MFQAVIRVHKVHHTRCTEPVVELVKVTLLLQLFVNLCILLKSTLLQYNTCNGIR